MSYTFSLSAHVPHPPLLSLYLYSHMTGTWLFCPCEFAGKLTLLNLQIYKCVFVYTNEGQVYVYMHLFFFVLLPNLAVLISHRSTPKLLAYFVPMMVTSDMGVW